MVKSLQRHNLRPKWLSVNESPIFFLFLGFIREMKFCKFTCGEETQGVEEGDGGGRRSGGGGGGQSGPRVEPSGECRMLAWFPQVS